MRDKKILRGKITGLKSPIRLELLVTININGSKKIEI